MPGLTPDAAFHDFFNPVQRAVRCLDSSARLGFKEVAEKLYVVSPGDGVPFAKGNATFKLFSWFNVRAIPYGDAWRVTTEQYIHEVRNHKGERIAAWHWHPKAPRSPIATPHLHVAADSPFCSLHYPTNRVSIEEVTRFIIEELEAEPANNAWESTLQTSEQLHRKHRTW